ncbi:MAG TPA: hypothetical protein DER33_10320 [Syntrophomonas sp.]|mgnify:FL=1|jgi:transcriptional regulator GlxA family with amidase domain|nr:hypothetical protein [Oscillospiraceae bacterium]HCF71956.1 hypothetical protein [Syntrophomonas sp.]
MQAANTKRLQSVFRYIKNNYTQAIDLKQLADIACLSVGHFCRIFKKLTGRSAIDYITQLRVEKAALLLRQGEYNIKEIAFATGFNDSNYFTRVFKKYKNTAPSEFKKRLAGEDSSHTKEARIM